MTDYDGIYHQIFGRPELVAQLLREFAPGPWLDDHDLDHIMRSNAKFHTEASERREGDEVWKIPRRTGGNTYLLLMLEFQAKSDRWMALRLLVYVGLVWQHVIDAKELLPDGRLPPVLPVVLHRGKPGWAAPTDLCELIGLDAGSALWQFQPALHYYVIDEVSFKEADLERRPGLVPLLFRAETTSDPGRLLAVVDALMAELGRNADFATLRRAFTQLLAGSMGPLPEGMLVPDDLVELRNMLEARFEDWAQEMLQKGRQEGRQEGEQTGRQAGEVALLTRQLERRFGPLPVWARDRIAAAGTEALENWGLRVLDGVSLDAVLA